MTNALLANSVHFRPLDLAAIVVYLTLMAGMGVWFSRRNQSTEHYFLGDRNFPGWAIGLSMLGTSISSVTFLAFPAAAYALDWRQLISNLTLPLVAVLAIIVFIPFFRRGNTTSAFEYLGDRFGTVPRLYGTLSFILLQLIRLGKVLFLVSIPVSLLTGWDIRLVIIGVGIFISFYTIAGGIEAVIWTDVIQTIVLWLGGILCFTIIMLQLPGGLGQVFEVGSAQGKFNVGSFDFNLTERTFWTVALLGIINWLTIYSSDQNVVQRFIAARSLREARKATTLYSILAVFTWSFFFLIGTCVFVFYQIHPDPAVKDLQADEIFPWFILTQVPAGLAGLVISGVMAAAMSSLDSSINSISTVMTVDLLKPWLAPGRDDRFYLRMARAIAILASALMIAGAIFFSSIEKESMNDLSWIIASVFGGCLLGLFMLGFFTRRIDNTAAIIGLAGAIVVNLYLGLSTGGWLPNHWTLPIHSYWVGILVNLAFIFIAVAVSLFRGANPRELHGLTVWTLKEQP
ncbi:sodium:solute symporter [Gimesia fumaroli]|uniref:Sodium/glucose cotransporter n=1 Tax=Gimesia fumaroli TaxID=2527976 RepID=A0A518ICY6_9PLAN|nr:sodium:solute symporter [Gimesia fumaroli]QDV50904.1 Sodium/glucose cotransporter [Gimesia fumaroli]